MKTVMFDILCCLALICGAFASPTQEIQVAQSSTQDVQVDQVNTQEVQVIQNGQDFDMTLGDLTENINTLIIGCSNYLPMVDAYMKSQNDNPDFLSGETDVITLQVSVDSAFNACKNILNVIAAYQLVISDYQ